MQHSVRDLKAVLGRNARFAVKIKPNESSVGASWPCGCQAEGPKFSDLHLRACATHLLGGLALYRNRMAESAKD